MPQTISKNKDDLQLILLLSCFVEHQHYTLSYFFKIKTRIISFGILKKHI